MRLKHLRLIPTGQITENLYAVKTGSVNLFVYKEGSDWIAMDSGFGTSILKRELSVLGIQPDKITHLFLTHSDFDHAGGYTVFQNAQIYLSAEEEPLIKRKTARKFGIIYNRKIDRSYKLLKNDDMVTVGTVKIKAIETPGHTPGSMSYLINDEILFVGDAFRLAEGKAYSNRPFYCMDPEKQKESIQKLARLNNIKLVFTAHGGHSNDFGYLMADQKTTFNDALL